ncbi:MAG TPA: helix-turn-helix domain-containing protein [Anaerolineales bacterium]|nr:helix-turn-helix domain-containing protein [Anaerolineales bacterium]
MEKFWTGPQVARIVGIPYDTLDYWVKSGLVRPSMPAPVPRRRSYYTFSDIVTIAALKALRRQGISLQKLKQARAELWKRIGISLEQGLQGGVIIADREQVLTVLYSLDEAVQIMSLLKGGQLVLPLSNVIEEVKMRVEGMFGEVYTVATVIPTEARVHNER